MDGSQKTDAVLAEVAALPWPEPTECLVVALAKRSSQLDQVHHQALRTVQAVRAATKSRVVVDSTLREGRAVPAILGAAKEFEADLIVLGGQDPNSRDEFHLGPVARAVAQRSGTPTLVFRPPLRGLANVVLATDGSAPAVRAREWLQQAPLGQENVLVTAVMPPTLDVCLPIQADHDAAKAYLRSMEDHARGMAQDLVSREADALATTGREVSAEVRQGSVSGMIVGAAEERHADLIVVGAQGKTGLAGMLGSVSLHVLEHAPCSVLVVH